MMGIAMGCVGMRMDDFCRCTPSEFKAIFNQWKENNESRQRGDWERVRMACLCSLQPYSKSTLTAEDIMTFPWEEKKEQRSEEKLTDEDIAARYAAAKKRYGLD